MVMNIEPYEKYKAVRMIDRSLIELASQSENSFKASSMLDKKTHIETLVDVLRMLQNDNETLFSVTLHFTMRLCVPVSRRRKTQMLPKSTLGLSIHI